MADVRSEDDRVLVVLVEELCKSLRASGMLLAYIALVSVCTLMLALVVVGLVDAGFMLVYMGVILGDEEVIPADVLIRLVGLGFKLEVVLMLMGSEVGLVRFVMVKAIGLVMTDVVLMLS